MPKRPNEFVNRDPNQVENVVVARASHVHIDGARRAVLVGDVLLVMKNNVAKLVCDRFDRTLAQRRIAPYVMDCVDTSAPIRDPYVMSDAPKTPRERLGGLLQDLNDRSQEYNAGIWAWDSSTPGSKSALWEALVRKKEEIQRLLLEIDDVLRELGE